MGGSISDLESTDIIRVVSFEVVSRRKTNNHDYLNIISWL